MITIHDFLEPGGPTEKTGGLRLVPGAGSASVLPPRYSTGFERRRSERVEPGRALFTELDRVGPARIVCLSLGGAILDGPARLESGHTYRLHLQYGGHRAELDLVAYRTSIQELFYSANGRSWICWRSRAVFREPSIFVLNFLYRVIGDHWSSPVGDDTRPAPEGV